MKVTVDAAALAAALKRSAAERRNTTLPILGHVAITADANLLTVRGTDLHCWTESRIDADIAQPGGKAFNFGQLSGLVGRLEGPVTLSASPESTTATLSAGRGRWRVDTLPITQFPEPDNASIRTATCAADGAALAEAISRVEYACDPNSLRQPYVRGVILGPKALVATNFHRIAIIHAATGIDKELVLPKAALAYVLPVLREGGTLAIGDRGDAMPCVLSAHSATHSVRAALIDTRPPLSNISDAAAQALAQPDGADVVVNREQLMEGLRRLAVVAPTHAVHKFQHVDMALTPEGLALTSGDVGSDVVPYAEPPEDLVPGLSMSFQMRYVTDAINAISTDTLQIIGGASGGTVAFCPTGEGGRDQLHCLAQARA